MNKREITKEMITFEDKVLRLDISSRGGGIEVDLDGFGYSGRMTAYQNYLGGGMLGRICSDCNIKKWRDDETLVEISEQLKRYFHSLTNPDDSDWESVSFEQNQRMPISAY